MILSQQPRQRLALGGFMMLEVLVALLVFSLGVLGVVGLQANAVKQSGQAKYRADASLLINELIGNMWVGDRTVATLQTNFASAGAGAGYTAWLARVQAEMPSASSYPPIVAVTQVDPLPIVAPITQTLTPSSRVTITVRWKAPSDAAGDAPHSLTMVTQIK